MRRTALVIFMWLSPLVPAVAQVTADEAAHQIAALENAQTVVTAPVEIDGNVLFRVRGVTSLPADQRAAGIRSRIEALARNPSFKTENLKTVDSGGYLSIMAGDVRVMALADADAQLEQVSLADLGRAGVDRIRDAIVQYRAERTTNSLLRAGVHALIATVVFTVAFVVLTWIAGKLELLLLRRLEGRIHSFGIQSFEIVRADRVIRILNALQRTFRLVVQFAFVVAYLSYVLRLFPFTRSTGNRLFELLAVPLVATGRDFLAAIPSLLFLTLLFIVTRFFLKLLRLFFDAVDRGTVRLDNFEQEWAEPTYKIVRLVVIALVAIIAYPYIPGSDSAAFKGISVFLGVLLSLGSSSAIANIIAGYTMIYRRAFRVGDRVKVGDTIGDVIEMRLQGTHVRTLKNEEVVIPSSQILNSHVVNYSSLGTKQGLILHTTVGIGYETPWRQVEAMLLLAASRTEGVEKEPAAFVHQTSLGDFAVNYELNAYTRAVPAMLEVYTSLHRNVLDVFNEYEVPIMTPAYVADPQDAKIVPKDRWNAPPAAQREREGG